MKRWIIVLQVVAVITAAGMAWGQPQREKAGRPGMGRGEEGRGPHPMMITKLVENTALAERLALTDEQLAQLKAAAARLTEKHSELSNQLEESVRKQAELFASKADFDESALMAAVEATGAIRTAIAKLRVEQLLVIRRTLTEEQIDKLRQGWRRKRSGEERQGEKEKRLRERQRPRKEADSPGNILRM